MYLGRAGQEPTENVCLDRPVQNGLSCGLCGSVWLCPELSRTKCFADEGLRSKAKFDTITPYDNLPAQVCFRWRKCEVDQRIAIPDPAIVGKGVSSRVRIAVRSHSSEIRLDQWKPVVNKLSLFLLDCLSRTLLRPFPLSDHDPQGAHTSTRL